MMFTGVPVRASMDPACAENASGMSSCDGLSARAATTTTSGSRAATALLTLITAVTTATSSPIVSSSGRRRVPARLITCCPAQATIPVDSRDSLTTNRRR
jgi:hypothetical protein